VVLCFSFLCLLFCFLFFFFFNDTATTEIYTLSLHDALPIWLKERDIAESVKDVHSLELEMLAELGLPGLLALAALLAGVVLAARDVLRADAPAAAGPAAALAAWLLHASIDWD